MAEFLKKPLRSLDRLYDIRGGQITTRFLDLSGISLVHDVAPEAERAACDQLTNAILQSTTGAFDDRPVAALPIEDNQGVIGAQGLRCTCEPIDNARAYLTGSNALASRISDIWTWVIGWTLGVDDDTALEAWAVVAARESYRAIATRTTGLVLGSGTDAVNSPIDGNERRPVLPTYGSELPVRLFNGTTQPEDDKVQATIRSTAALEATLTVEAYYTYAGIYPWWIYG